MRPLRPFALTTAALLLAACGEPAPGISREDRDEIASHESGLTLCPSGATVTGIDVSSWQATVNWPAVAASGVGFAIARINDGTYLDPQFDRNWQQMKASGLIRGAYQFFEPTVDVDWQANLVIQKVGPLGPGDLPVALDVEWPAHGGTPQAWQLQRWIDLVWAGTGKRPMIYTVWGYWSSYFDRDFGVPLWVANYGVSCPSLPAGWKGWTFWQHSSTGNLAGLSPLDLNVFNGSSRELAAFAGSGGTSAALPVRYTRRVGFNADGRQEVFLRAPDASIRHTWQSAPSSGWSGWGDLGGGLKSEPVAGADADGRLELFAVGVDGAIWHRFQTGSDPAWSDWYTLGGADITGEPAVGSNADGRLELFVRTSDGRVFHQWQTAPSGGWAGEWREFGGAIKSDVVMASNADGRLELFARGGDDQLLHAWQLTPNGGWSGWEPLGGVLISEPAVARNADGRLEVHSVGTDGALWSTWQTGGGWSGFYSLGGANLIGEPALVLDADGRLEAFARASDGSFFHAWQLSPGGSWSGWAYTGGSGTDDPFVGINSDGRLELFARGWDGALWHRWQLGAHDGWSGWVSLGQ